MILIIGDWIVTCHVTAPIIPCVVTMPLAACVGRVGPVDSVRVTSMSVRSPVSVLSPRCVGTPPALTPVAVPRAIRGTPPGHLVNVSDRQQRALFVGSYGTLTDNGNRYMMMAILHNLVCYVNLSTLIETLIVLIMINFGSMLFFSKNYIF